MVDYQKRSSYLESEIKRLEKREEQLTMYNQQQAKKIKFLEDQLRNMKGEGTK